MYKANMFRFEVVGAVMMGWMPMSAVVGPSAEDTAEAVTRTTER